MNTNGDINTNQLSIRITDIGFDDYDGYFITLPRRSGRYPWDPGEKTDDSLVAVNPDKLMN